MSTRQITILRNYGNSYAKGPMNPVAILEKIEWASYRQGPGSGPHDSGGDGAWVPACPWCGGVKPTDPMSRLFNDTARGHDPHCELAKAIAPPPEKKRFRKKSVDKG